jgi:DNA-binding LacI/PurR family transcriptional regulator
MWKAARALKDQGKLRGGYRVSQGGAGPAPADQDVSGAPAARLEERMTRDLLSGAIVRNGQLQSVKELVARYGTSAPTLQRITDRIRQQGLLFAHGRRYRTLPSEQRERPKVVLVTCAAGPTGLFLPPLEMEFLRSCEALCVNANALLEITVVRRFGPNLEFTDVRGNRDTGLPKTADVAGYIYLLDSPEGFDAVIMQSLIATRKPIAVLDQAWVFPNERKDFDLPRVRIFTASGREMPGREMACYLLAKGHRNLAYISPFHADAWSQNRCAGVRRTVRLAGSGYALAEFTHNKSVKTDDYEKAGWTKSHGRAFEKQFARWKEQTPSICRRDLEIMGSIDHTLLFLTMGTRIALYELLDNAVAHAGITAWVMANDYVARMAWEYCLDKKIAVPHDTAIVGFDNTDAASTSRITSYNFNFPAVASAVIQFLLNPQGGFWSRRRVVEIGGKIMERETG